MLLCKTINVQADSETYLGESLYSSPVPGSTLSGQETQGTVSGSFVLSVRHLDFHEDA